MNILLLHQYFLEEDGAGGARFNEMTRIWSDNGHHISVIAGMMPDHTGMKRPEYKGKKFAFKKQGNVSVYRCHVSESYNISFVGRAIGYFSFTWFALWFGIFKVKGKFDVVLVSSPPIFIGAVGFIFSKLKGIPMIFEIRDLWPESAIDTGVLKNKLIIKISYWFEQFLYRESRRIVVLTPAFRDILINKKNISSSRIIYIPNAADLNLTEPLMLNFDSNKLREERGAINKFIIVYVGAHGLANGLHQILDTAELLTDTNVVFWLIGKGMKREELISDANRRNLNNIEFIDPVPREEVFRFILASDMGTSVLIKCDTFKTIYSNKTFDYLSCKKPVFLAIDGVSRKLIEEADAGIYVEPENPEDFARKIRLYLNNPDLVKQQGQNGYHYVKRNFNRLDLAAEYLEFLGSVN